MKSIISSSITPLDERYIVAPAIKAPTRRYAITNKIVIIN